VQDERKVVELNIDDVLPNRFQPRIKFNEDSINELSISIKKYGVIQPIVVRKIGNKYEIIAGERRYKASVLAGKKTIPAIISELSDKDSVEIALIENVQREDLTPIEKAVSYKKILDMGYITQEDLAEKVGKSQSAIANTLRLLNLTDEVQEALLENKISERHARSLLKLKDEKKQVELLNKIIEERLTVRKTDEEIDKMLNGLNNVEIKNEENNNEVVNIPDVETKDNLDFKLPGFMNIDEIEKNASDINVSKPTADMDQLLGSSGVQANPDAEVIPYNDTLQSNKFFNFFDETVEETKESNPIEIPSLDVPVAPAAEVPSFDVPAVPAVEIPSFDVPAAPAVEVPSIDVPAAPAVEIPSFDAPVAPVEIPSFDVPSAPAVEIPSFDVPAVPAVEVPSIDVPAAPVVEIPSFDAPVAPAVEIPSFDAPVAPAVEIPSFDAPVAPVEIPSFDAPVAPVEIPSFNVPAAPAVEIPSFDVPAAPVAEVPSFDAPVAPVAEVPSFDVPVAPVAEVPSFDVPVAPVAEVPSFDVPVEEPNNNEVEILPTIDVGPVVEPFNISSTVSEPMVINANLDVSKPNLKLALDKIRECEKELQNLGFVVEMDEIDFENNYEVIFKIEK